MYRRRRLIIGLLITLFSLGGAVFGALREQPVAPETAQQSTPQSTAISPAAEILRTLAVKGRAPKTGYSRAQFGSGWQAYGACDVRNYILARDMEQEVLRSPEDCTVLSGRLSDPYTTQTIDFRRGPETSDDVQIDHVVALSDAWQKGAQALSPEQRVQLANDPLNLLAVSGKANNDKSDADAASWLPPNKTYRCRYVARQIAVKQKYHLWVTAAERDAMARVLSHCPGQQLPQVTMP